MSAFRVGSIKSEMRFGIDEFKRGMREVATGASQIKDMMAGASIQTAATSAALGGVAGQFSALAKTANAAIAATIVRMVAMRSESVRAARELDNLNRAANLRHVAALNSDRVVSEGFRGVRNEEAAVAALTTRYTGLTATLTKAAVAIGATGIAAGILANRLMTTVRASMAFEDSFAFVRKTVDGTKEQLAELSKELQKMAQIVPVTVHELNQVAGAAGQLGVARENIADFTRIMVEMGVSSDLTAEQAAVGFAQWANITGLATEEIDGLTNAVVLLGNTTATTESNILNMGVRLAGAARVIGMSDADVVGLAASMASLRIEAEAGGTAMSKIMLDLQASVDRGGRELELFSAIAGKTAREFTEQFREAPVKALSDFVGGLSRVEASGQSVTAVLDMLGLSEVRTRDALMRLAGGADILADNIRRAGEEFRDGTARSDEAAAAFDRTSAKVQLLANAKEALARTIGDGLKPQYEALIVTLTSVVQWLDTVIDKIGSATVAWKGMLALPTAGATLGGLVGDVVNTYIPSRVRNAFSSVAVEMQPSDFAMDPSGATGYVSITRDRQVAAAAASESALLDNILKLSQKANIPVQGLADNFRDAATNAADLERSMASMDPRFQRIAELNPVTVFREELQELNKLVADFPNAMSASMREDAFQDMWRRTREGFDTIADAAKMVPEDFREEFVKSASIVEAELEQKIGRGAGRKLGDEAGKAYERAMEEALRFKIQLFPDEALAEEVRRIQKMAEQFPEIMTDAAVDRAFDQILKNFEGRGVDAVKAIRTHLLNLPESFAGAMEQAVLRADVAAREALMDSMARSEDSRSLSLAGDSMRRGRDLSDALSGDAIVARMAMDIEDLKAAGRMDTETGNLLARDYWDELAEVTSETFDAIRSRVMDLAPDMVPELDRIREALRFDTAVQAFEDLGRTALETGNKLRRMGATGIANVLQRMGQAVSIGVNMANTIKQLPDLYAKFADSATSAAVKVGTAMHIALSWLALIADAIALVISLFGDWGEEGQKELKGMAKVVDELKDAMDNFVDAITDHLLEFVKTGELAFRDLIEYITDEIFRITVSNLVVSPLLDLGVGLLGFKDGGAFEKGHVVDSPEVFGTKSGLAVRGEAGTEVVMPAIRLADGTLGVKSVGGGGMPVINIYDHREAGAPPVEVSHRTGLDGERFLDIVVRKVEKSIIEGDFDRALSLIGPRLR